MVYSVGEWVDLIRPAKAMVGYPLFAQPLSIFSPLMPMGVTCQYGTACPTWNQMPRVGHGSVANRSVGPICCEVFFV